MRTEDLLTALAADVETRPASLGAGFAVALVVGALVTGGAFFATLGPRPDVAAAATTVRFLLKFVETAALAAAATLLVMRMVRPAADRRPGRLLLAAVPLLLAAAVVVELVLVPETAWGSKLIGTNWYHCLGLVPLLALPPFVTLMAAARHGAPTDPRRTGAVVGLAAAGIGAFFYAANCTDDSPLFVATWYTIATAVVAGVGALVGDRVLRW